MSRLSIAVGVFVAGFRDAVAAVAVVIFCVMGVLTARTINLPFIPSTVQSEGRCFARSYLLGAVNELAGVGVGPFFDAVHAVAVASSSVLRGSRPSVFHEQNG